MRVEVSGEDHHEDIDLVDEYAECSNNKAVEVLAGPPFEGQEDSAEKFGTVKPFERVSACWPQSSLPEVSVTYHAMPVSATKTTTSSVEAKGPTTKPSFVVAIVSDSFKPWEWL
jgi:hypothetical protein